jgi:hypothetical protein
MTFESSPEHEYIKSSDALFILLAFHPDAKLHAPENVWGPVVIIPGNVVPAGCNVNIVPDIVAPFALDTDPKPGNI